MNFKTEMQRLHTLPVTVFQKAGLTQELRGVMAGRAPESLPHWILILATSDWQAVGVVESIRQQLRGPVAMANPETNSLCNFEQIA